MEKLIDISSYPVVKVLDVLLQDKSTKKNIIWATDTYEELGEGFTDKVQMNADTLLQRPDLIRPRIQKSQEAQAQRTRKKAEVFTPAWLCNQMNNYCDDDWFRRSGVFNAEHDDHIWTVSEGKVEFPKKKKWQRYVDSRRLEITCGEAPYLVSRYDVSIGELIVPPIQRIGMLDRKLRIVNENTDTYEEWLKWTIRAFESSYGYEYQGDNVLIARINLLLTFTDYYEERWQRNPDIKLLKKIANKIAWNIWQMDGLKNTVPLGKPYEEYQQITFYDTASMGDNTTPEAVPCRIFDWRRDSSLKFVDVKEVQAMGKKLFDYVIGNPPYQEEQISENADGSLKNYAPPVYDKFMEEAFKVAKKVELVHPARFLFNAGSTPKAWNEKMLKDEHFKVLYYEEDGHKVFPSLSTPLRGGVAITYHDDSANYGAIIAFTKYPEVNGILHKVLHNGDFKTLMDIVYSRTAYRLTDAMHKDHPEARYKEGKNGENIGLLSKGHDYDMSSNIMSLIPQIFHEQKPNDGKDYIQILGRVNSKRIYRYIRRDYVKDVDNLDWYKVYVAQANGSGEFGETMSEPVVEGPGVGATETFLSIGKFKTIEEARAVKKYIKTKFARTLLSVLKVTQNGNKPVWKMIPLQDFTPNSDIDWSKSIHEIDLQLYHKYGLDEKEIEFIETHVKEMV